MDSGIAGCALEPSLEFRSGEGWRWELRVFSSSWAAESSSWFSSFIPQLMVAASTHGGSSGSLTGTFFPCPFPALFAFCLVPAWLQTLELAFISLVTFRVVSNLILMCKPQLLPTPRQIRHPCYLCTLYISMQLRQVLPFWLMGVQGGSVRSLWRWFQKKSYWSTEHMLAEFRHSSQTLN